MNSIDTIDTDQGKGDGAGDEGAGLTERLGALFDEVVLPMAERLREQGGQAFPMAPDVSWLSYYVRRRRSAMTPDDFMRASCADVAELEQRLRAHWESLGRAELAAHAGRFAGAAQPLSAQTQASAELSPYVYAMF